LVGGGMEGRIEGRGQVCLDIIPLFGDLLLIKEDLGLHTRVFCFVLIYTLWNTFVVWCFQVYVFMRLVHARGGRQGESHDNKKIPIPTRNTRSGARVYPGYPGKAIKFCR